MGALPFDAATAVDYGLFVKMAYDMYAAAPTNPTPPPTVLPAGYTFHAWVKMKDFIVGSGDWSFYGVMVRRTADPSTFVLAIRGTSNLEEWWDDLTSIVPAPWAGFGLVGYGFNRIYQTLELVEYHEPTAGMAPAPAAPAQSMAAAGSFAHQVAASVHNVPAGAMAEAAPAPKKVTVVGHSLGSALATLYVAENASAAPGAITTPLLCTFASPRVGDPGFATTFDALPVTSWRIVNELDIVPKLPAVGFQHVDALQLYNSGNATHWSLTCWHALDTYLHLLDPKQSLGSGCAAWLAMAAAAPLRAAPPRPMGMVAAAAPGTPIALSVPSGTGATIDITIKVS